MPPLLPPLGYLAIGILLAPWLETGYAQAPLALIAALSVFRAGLRPLALLLTGMALGGGPGPRAPEPIQDDGLPRRIEARLVTAPALSGEGWFFVVEVTRVDGRAVRAGRARLAWFPDAYGSETLFRDLGLGRGDRIGILVRLRPPTWYRNPGGFDYRTFLAKQGIFWTGTLRSPRLVEVFERGWHAPDQVREWLVDRIGRYFSDPTRRALALGMVLGQRRLLPPDDARRFEEAGLVHLLVASGFNLAVVAAVAAGLGRLLRLGRLRRAALTLALIAGYAALVGAEIPIVRAAIMAAWVVAGAALDRGYRPGNALAGTAMLLLVTDPGTITDRSFLLSFGAVGAILLLGGPAVSWAERRVKPALCDPGNAALDRRLDDGAIDLRVAMRIRSERRGWPLAWTTLSLRVLVVAGEVALITAAIQLVLLPFAVESFHRIGWVSLPLNVLGAMVAAFVTPLGLALTLLPLSLGAPLALIIDLLLGLLTFAVRAAVELPGATLRVPSAPAFLWLLFAAGLGALVTAIRARSRPGAALGLVLTVGTVLAMAFVDFSPPPPRHPVVTVLDVGQGDSILVEAPDGRRVLVDGGGIRSGGPESGRFRIGEEVVSPYLFSRRFRKIDVLALSHAHHDHLDGLLDLVRNFKIGEIWVGPNPTTPAYLELLDLASFHGIAIRNVRAGARLGPFTVLHPPPDHRVGTEVRNDDSVVLGFEWAGQKVLLAGDLERDLAAPDWTRVALLKVPHHGSADAALDVQAAIPVISVGGNNAFGHPSPSRLPALRTDLMGAIQVDLRPEGPEVSFPGLSAKPLR